VDLLLDDGVASWVGRTVPADVSIMIIYSMLDQLLNGTAIELARWHWDRFQRAF
jgi:hypothetical protein